MPDYTIGALRRFWLAILKSQTLPGRSKDLPGFVRFWCSARTPAARIAGAPSFASFCIRERPEAVAAALIALRMKRATDIVRVAATPRHCSVRLLGPNELQSAVAALENVAADGIDFNRPSGGFCSRHRGGESPTAATAGTTVGAPAGPRTRRFVCVP